MDELAPITFRLSNLHLESGEFKSHDGATLFNSIYILLK